MTQSMSAADMGCHSSAIVMATAGRCSDRNMDIGAGSVKVCWMANDAWPVMPVHAEVGSTNAECQFY